MGCCQIKEGNVEVGEVRRDSFVDYDRNYDQSYVEMRVREPYMGYVNTEYEVIEQFDPKSKPSKSDEVYTSNHDEKETHENGTPENELENYNKDYLQGDKGRKTIHLRATNGKKIENNDDVKNDSLANKMSIPLDKYAFDELSNDRDFMINYNSKYAERPNFYFHKDSEYSTMRRNIMLTIIESKYNPVGKYIIITPSGVKGSKRISSVVNFGLNSDIYHNDIYFKPEEGICERHFTIIYDHDLNCYRIKNFDNSGVYIKIEEKHILNDNSIFTFGGNHLLTQIRTDQDDDNEISLICFEVLFGPNKGKK